MTNQGKFDYLKFGGLTVISSKSRRPERIDLNPPEDLDPPPEQ